MSRALDNDSEDTVAPLNSPALKAWIKRIGETTVGPDLASELAARPPLGARDTDAATTETNKQRGCRPVRSQAVVESLIARQKLIGYLTAEQHLDLTELSHSYPGIEEFLPTEIAVALGISDMAAAARLNRAHQFVYELPATFEALRRGELAPDKAELIRRLTVDVPAPLRERVEQDVLSRAAGQSMLQLEYAVRRAVLHHDPAGAEDRRVKAARNRQIRISRLPNEMASLYFVSDAADMAVIKTCLDEHARLAATPEDTRTADARRVDVLVDLCAEALHQLNNPQDRTEASTGHPPAGSVDPNATGTPTTGAGGAAGGQRRTTVASGDRTDEADNTSQPTPAQMPDETGLAESVPAESTPADAAPVRDLTDPTADDPITDNLTETIVGASDTSAERRASGATPERTSDAGTAGITNAGQHDNTAQPMNTPQTSDADHLPGIGDTLRQARRHHGIARISLIVPHDVLLGLHGVCELSGYGPIGATHALRLFAPDAEYLRLITEPQSGKLLDYHRSRYIPPDWLKQFVKHRDQTCRAPGCHRPAERCEVDHVTPYSKGGTTSAINLLDLCKHHHRAKDGGEHTVTVDPYGDAFWTTPLGYQAVTKPADLTPEPANRTFIDGGPARPEHKPPDRDRPPF